MSANKNTKASHEPHLDESLLRWLDGTLSPAEAQLVVQALAERHDAREAYVELCLTQAALAEATASGMLAPPEVPAASDDPFETLCGIAPLGGAAVDSGAAVVDGMSGATVVPLAPPVFWSLCLMAIVVLSGLLTWGNWALLRTPPAHEGSTLAAADPFGTEHIATLAQVTACRWEQDDVRFVSGARLAPGEIGLASGVAEILFDPGPRVVLEGPARFMPQSDRGGFLHRGRLVAHTLSKSVGFTVQTPAAIVADYGAEYGLAVGGDGATEVHVFAGMVDISPRQDGALEPVRHRVAAQQSLRIELQSAGAVRVEPIAFDGRQFLRSLPQRALAYPPALVSYWNFDEQGGPASDLVGRNDGALQGVVRVPGLVGRGAVRFDDLPGQMVHVGTGSGSFRCTAGITIEALFTSRFRPTDDPQRRPAYDEIFRKEDGTRRILLSFQHDGETNAHYALPEVPPGPVLSFGLNVGGRYDELDMPLDGREGRPSLAEISDGRPHHVAATYDTQSGEKALYIDGVKRFAHWYPSGSPLATGGERPAVIGNFEANSWEVFAGVIDEVAVYRAALSAEEIAEHARRARQGWPYFSPPTDAEEEGSPHRVTL